jgi:hypothetical protein
LDAALGDKTASILKNVDEPLGLATMGTSIASSAQRRMKESNIIANGGAYDFHVRNGKDYPDETEKSFSPTRKRRHMRSYWRGLRKAAIGRLPGFRDR